LRSNFVVADIVLLALLPLSPLVAAAALERRRRDEAPLDSEKKSIIDDAAFRLIVCFIRALGK